VKVGKNFLIYVFIFIIVLFSITIAIGLSNNKTKPDANISAIINKVDNNIPLTQDEQKTWDNYEKWLIDEMNKNKGK
jgi:hypothetical protein